MCGSEGVKPPAQSAGCAARRRLICAQTVAYVLAGKGSLRAPGRDRRSPQVGTMKASKRHAAVAALLLALCGAGGMAAAGDPLVDCLSDDNGRRIGGCSALIETQGRAGAAKLRLRHAGARLFADAACSTRRSPTTTRRSTSTPTMPSRSTTGPGPISSSAAASEGAHDVERALQLSPGSPYALDTRAHIRQADGDADAALRRLRASPCATAATASSSCTSAGCARRVFTSARSTASARRR